ncbi:MAG: phosphatidate cytidylyltransferase [Micrococcaceae bacterium]
MSLSKKSGRNMPMAVASSIVLMAVVLIPLFFFPLLFAVVVSLFAALGTYELSEVLKEKRNFRANSYFLAFVAFCLALLGYFQPNFLYVIFALCFMVIAGIGSYLETQRSLEAKLAVVIMMYVPFLLGVANIMIRQHWGKEAIILALLLVIANDTGGLIAGMNFGKHKLAPTISPGKTWEGSAGSLLLASVVGIFLITQFSPLPWWWGVIAAAYIVIAATCGDLFESKIKRTLGIKDMSHLIPGHGGVMDRLDSIVFALPVIFILWMIVEQLNILP